MVKLRENSPVVCTYVDCICLSFFGGASFHITVAEFCVIAFMSFFSSAFFGGSSDAIHYFEGVTSLDELGALFPLPSGVYSFVSDAGLSFTLPDSRLGYQ